MYTDQMIADVMGMTLEQWREYNKSAAPRLNAAAVRAQMKGDAVVMHAALAAQKKIEKKIRAKK